jgi:hypothetical protein
LKNGVGVNDIFVCGNNLLSSVPISYSSSQMRDYTTIFQDIYHENDNELVVNYVYYNTEYRIGMGDTEINTPDTLYPFDKLNINDTKFVNSGAFAFPLPEYADKVYHLSKDPKNRDNGQFLLCTWLSGAPFSDDKVWVDRYYYPDYITKEAALSSLPYADITYSDQIELLIRNNTELKEFVQNYPYFDKKSDLCFEPNETYIYSRNSIVPSTSHTQEFVSYCNQTVGQIETKSYFSKINNIGKYTLSFRVDGDDSSWKVQSDRNTINCGLTIEKNGLILKVLVEFYEPSSRTFETFEGEVSLAKDKLSYFIFSLDGSKGIGYAYLDNDFFLDFSFSPYKYSRKQLLYGDFYVITSTGKQDFLLFQGNPSNPQITYDYLEKSLTFTKPILDGGMIIDEIIVTLPSGMRNQSDNIELLQTVCGYSSFKSNSINIHIKNTDITNDSIISGINSQINSIDLPVNTKINTINYKNYK